MLHESGLIQSRVTDRGADAQPTSGIWLGRCSLALFLIALAWAPFPLGSNRPWSWSLLCLIVALSWTLWCASMWRSPRSLRRLVRGLEWPLVLGALALAWGVVQIVPLVPRSWSHPVWGLAETILSTHLNATISLDPWRSGTELMKLASYGMAFCLARVFSSREEQARRLLNWLIATTGAYAAYAVVLAASHISQFNVFYSAPKMIEKVSGSFVGHNHFATYAGLGALCAGSRLIERGSAALRANRGWREFTLSLLQFLIGRGAPYVVAAVLTISVLVATTSRAANAGFLVAVAVLFVLSLGLGARQSRTLWPTSIGIAALAGLVVLFAINGNMLMTRFDDIAASGFHENMRIQLWSAATRMIQDAPLLGLGLGTYVVAYPTYSDVVQPFIMDKAHNDYLELAAGWGLPAAILWWSAIAWLVLLCFRGAFLRRRNLVYPMLAIGASVLVGVHSAFDFSLQIPAVALTFSAILGLGVAQAFPTRDAA